MKNWSLNTKVLLIMSIFITGSIIIFVTGLIGMSKLDVTLDDIVSKNAARVDLAHEIENSFTMLSLTEKNFILESTKEGREGYKGRLNEIEKEMYGYTESYLKIASSNGKKDIQDFRVEFAAWKKINEEVFKLALNNKDQEAFKLSATAGKEAREKAEVISKGMVDRNQKVMLSEAKKADVIVDEIRLTMVITSIIAIFSGMIFAYFVMRAVNRAIDDVILNLTDSSGQVTSAAHQIAATAEELSGAVTEQAASLEETAATVEELNSMVQKTAENAFKSSGLSTNSRDNAIKGKNVVNEMVVAIDDINKSNDHIMESINESNQKIAQIVNVITEIGTKTKVINDIVFQTKLLSFNASVEAARAGEHGKGFSVVAEEIGNLARMSGDSAKEITKMLDDSITTVQNIVSETKANVERLVHEGKLKVETGTKIAHECDDVLTEIVSNVANVTSMAQEISSACKEQAMGVQEITKAMGQLDQVTQNNSATSEEAASAANELSAQADSLRSVIGVLVHTIKGQPHEEKAKHINNVVNFTPAAKQTQAFKNASGDVPVRNDSRFRDV